jgi:hypothetical protein
MPSIADHFRLQATISLRRLYDTTIMLPTYSKQYDAEDTTVDTASDPLLGQYEGRTSTETAPPVYPPSSSLAPPPSTEGRHNVVYEYKPVFPREGDNQYAVGVLGRSRAVSYIHSSRYTLLSKSILAPHAFCHINWLFDQSLQMLIY